MGDKNKATAALTNFIDPLSRPGVAVVKVAGDTRVAALGTATV